MSLIEFSLKRRVTVCMCAVAVLVFGTVSFFRLPINLLPDISYPSLTVETRYPGAAPEEIESLISRPVEEAVGVVSGVQRLISVSRPGVSQVTLEFAWGRDMDFASIDVREKLDLVFLPREAEKPVLLRFDPANDPVVRLYLTGAKSLYQLRYVAEEVLKKDLESTEGVAAIKVNGGYEEEIQVRVDQGKLSLLGIGIAEVNQKLQRENINRAGGSLYEQEARYLVRSRNQFRNLQDIMDTVLVSRDGRNVRMVDVAEVVRGHKRREVITRFGGKEAVELALYKEGDVNTVTVARNIRRRLASVEGELPEGIEVVAGIDQSRFIQASVDQVKWNAIVGGLIAIVLLLFFLKDLTSTLIIGLSIPISVIATFFLMYQTGTSLNIMSLGGLALGVGMLVDNAIVVLESIYKRRERGEAALQAALGGASEVGRAVVASTLTTIAVFLPVVFVEGIAAQLFRDQALTVSFSLLASLVVSLTLIPMMAAIFTGSRTPVVEQAAVSAAAPVRVDTKFRRIIAPILRFRGSLFWCFEWLIVGLLRNARWLFQALLISFVFLSRPFSRLFDGLLGAVTRSYEPMLGWALRSRGIVIALALVAFLGAMSIGRGLGVDLIPTFSQGEFSFRVELPEGTPLEMTDRYMQEIQAVLDDEPLVESYSAIIGGAGLSLTNTGTEGENISRLQVRMKSRSSSRDEQVVIDRLRARLDTTGRARYEFQRPTYFTFRTPIEVEVYGEDLEELQVAAIALENDVERIPGIVDVKSSLELGNPELQVTFNREQLSRLGLNLFDVASTIRNKVQGEVATRFLEGDREIDILVRAVDVGTASIDDVQDMIIAQRNGVPIFLKSVSEVKLTEGPSEIRRIGQKRAIVIAGNLHGRDMGAVAADVRSVIRNALLPAGVVAALSGQEEEMQRSLRSLLMAMALAIFLVYLVMASQFESFIHPFVVIFTVPLGVIGAVLGLALTGNTINVVALIGAVMLAGIVVNNAIVLIDTVNQRRQQGMSREQALIDAGKSRLRPVLMTSSTTILGLMPMALGLGEGSELRAPLAITVIGGLAVATLLTLVVIPVMYTLLDRKSFAAATGLSPAPEGGAGGSVTRDRGFGAVPSTAMPLPAMAGPDDPLGALPIDREIPPPREVTE
ncbi:MAG: efflux RND transporter permease subunit [Acidobacteria bacterium]|nr:efflux RND transporter permease subunit [Acidobacteriota bacterium]